MFDAASRYKFKISRSNDMGLDAHVIDECVDGLIGEAETIVPRNVDLSSFEPQDSLNPKIWVNGLMNSRVRMRLLEIADDFIDFLDVNWCDYEDIIVTGSIANYNWSKYSDIDLHVIYDFNDVDERTEFVKEYFDAKKREWNDRHGEITIYGFPVELYVQDSNEEHASTGIYSLEDNKWLVKPSKGGIDMTKANKPLIRSKVAEAVGKIAKMEELANTTKDEYEMRKLSEKVDKLFKKIKGTRRESLKKYGEGGTGNIFFKALRRLGYMDKLLDLRDKTYNRMKTLEK